MIVSANGPHHSHDLDKNLHNHSLYQELLYIAYKVDFYRIEQQYQKIKASWYGKYSIAILAV